MLAFHKFPPFELEKPPFYPLVGEHRCTFTASVGWRKPQSEIAAQGITSQTHWNILFSEHGVGFHGPVLCPAVAAATHSRTWAEASAWKWVTWTVPLRSDRGHLWPAAELLGTRSTASSHQSGSAAPSLTQLVRCSYLANKQIRCCVEACGVCMSTYTGR